MDSLAFLYRSYTARTGKAEPVIHAALLTYAILLLLSAVLNLFAPAWVSRNAPLAQPHPFDVAQSHSFNLSSPHLSKHVNEKDISRCLSRGLLLDVAHDPVVNRVRAEMDCGCRVPDVYEPHETPNVCAIIQSFNHEQNIPQIARSLVGNPAIQEVIVCEDGSSDSSLDRWMEHLRDFKHFIVVSNNLHETRCYNRAMRMSSAEFFILLQDDDLPPNAPPASSADIPADTLGKLNWVSHALELFDADPKLGVLSGFIGQLWAGETGYEFGEQTSDHGGTKTGKTLRIPFLSSRTLHPFMYAECAWAAPLFIRAQALHRIGGLDIGLFRKREPGVWQDCVLSYASWTAGWRVGVYDSGFRRGVGGHGSTSSPEKTKLRAVLWRRAKDTCDARYDRPFIHTHVLSLNNQTLLKRFDK